MAGAAQADAPKKKKRVIAESDDSGDDSPLAALATQAVKRAKIEPVEPAVNGHAEPNGIVHKPKPPPATISAPTEPPPPAASEDSIEVPLSSAPIVSAGPPVVKKATAMNGKRPRPPIASTSAASGSDSDAPLGKAPPVKKAKKAVVKARAVKSEPDLSDDSDAPIADLPLKSTKPAKKSTKAKANGTSSAKPKSGSSSKGKAAPIAKTESTDDEDSEEDKPLLQAKKARAKPTKASGGGKTKKGDKLKAVKVLEDAMTSPAVARIKSQSKGKGKAKKAASEEVESDVGPSIKGDVDKNDDSENEDYKWSLQESGDADDSVKWNTLEHNGILFPPPYEPHGVKMNYNGKPVTLPPEAEEVATFFAALLESDHAEKEVFRDNFFKDFQGVLKEHPPVENVNIKDFDKCDFRPIFDWCESERAKKKGLTKDEKKTIKAAKDVLEEPFMFCVLNGRKEKVGNFRVEPPGLFRGRGAHPKTGMLKKRVTPEQITINIGKDAEIPTPPDGHQWGKVTHDNTVSWLAGWNENINGAFKYVFLAAGSSLKGISDLKKYEKARELKTHIERIRSDYNRELTDKLMATRQRATALYLIDLFALRAGNEKGDDEADTVGCCSLRCEHITLAPPTEVVFDFLGKDSIRYHNTVNVDAQVFKNLKIFKKNKDDGDLLFDRLTTTLLNKHLGEYMTGLSAKVFRTYNASWTFQNELERMTNADDSTADKVLAYNRANRRVAILCNHQKSVSKTHGAAMEKMNDKLRALKYQRMKLRHALFTLDAKNKKKYSEYDEDESDLEDDWVVAYEEAVTEKAKETARKKFEKENAALAEAGDKVKPESVLAEICTELDEDLKRLVKERKSKKVEAKRGQTDEKLVAAIGKIDDRMAAQRSATIDKDEGKETSLGTSKLNYIDPRLTFAWCKKFDVPVEKMFSKTLRDKFTWAADVDADWTF